MVRHDATDTGKLVSLGLADQAADGRARLAGDRQIFPAGWRLANATLYDRHHISIAQLRAQRAFTAIDLGRDGGVSQLGMNRVGKVQRGRAGRQGDQITLGGKAINLVGEHLELGVLEKLVRVPALVENFHEWTQALQRITTGGLGRVRVVFIGLVLVTPMRRNTAFSDRLHFLGTDLQLDTHAVRTDNRRVQRAIIVWLGNRDEIPKALRYTAPRLVDHAHRPITIIRVGNDQAESIDVGDLVKGQPLAFQLAPDRIGALLTAENSRINAIAHQ